MRFGSAIAADIRAYGDLKLLRLNVDDSFVLVEFGSKPFGSCDRQLARC